jgi:hypothetical protein
MPTGVCVLLSAKNRFDACVLLTKEKREEETGCCDSCFVARIRTEEHHYKK